MLSSKSCLSVARGPGTDPCDEIGEGRGVRRGNLVTARGLPSRVGGLAPLATAGEEGNGLDGGLIGLRALC